MKSTALAILFSSLVFVACATTVDPIPGPATTIDTTPPGRETAEEKKAPPPAPLPDKDPNAGECKGETTQTACFQCCDDKHEEGAGVFYLALFGCICEDDKCQAACASTICNDANPAEPNADCNVCMAEKNVACQAPVATACKASPACIAYDKCVESSGCAGKKPK
jgi:hypothetical protein